MHVNINDYAPENALAHEFGHIDDLIHDEKGNDRPWSGEGSIPSTHEAMNGINCREDTLNPRVIRARNAEDKFDKLKSH